MASRWNWLVVDARDPERIADFWCRALDFQVLGKEDFGVWIGMDERTAPRLLFQRVPEHKTVKNRLHMDLTPDDQDAEVERLLGLGATPADAGQTGDESWVVLADPEGNEFCVLRHEES
jgi:predicted enzyme related to lactoylglutathione lyase